MKRLFFTAFCVLLASCANKANSQGTSAAPDSVIARQGKPARTVIIYSSKYGTTEKVANMIAEKISETNDVTLIALNEVPNPDISGYEKVILGTSIYMGKPRDNMKDFTKKKEAVFENKIVGLFICGGETKQDKQAEELKKAYPDYLHNMAKVESFMGGEYNLEKMSSFERKAIKMISKVKESTSFLNYEAIGNFANQMK